MDLFDEKLARLRSTLLPSSNIYDVPKKHLTSSANGALQNGVKEDKSQLQYENLKQPSQSAPSPNPNSADIYMNLQDFNLDSKNVYAILEPTGENQPEEGSEHMGKRDSIYDNAAEISAYLKEQGKEVVGSHTYELLDTDSTDGAMMSRPAPPTSAAVEEIELEHVLVFKNLPPLICRSQLGDEYGMTKLADTASSVLKAVVKDIHSSFG